MLSVVGGLFNLIGSGVGSFFGLKEKQVDLAKTALEVLKDSNASAVQRETAIATVLVAEANSTSWLTRNWRPLTMVVLTMLVISYGFGYTPINLLKPMPETSMIKEIFELVKVGLMGYIPARSVEKVVSSFTTAQNTKRLLEYFTNAKSRSE